MQFLHQTSVIITILSKFAIQSNFLLHDVIKIFKCLDQFIDLAVNCE